MLVHGTVISRELYREIIKENSCLSIKPHLTIITCAPNRATRQYLDRKLRRAREVGIVTSIVEFEDGVRTEELARSVTSHAELTNGIVVQLPLPKGVDTNAVCAAIPPRVDVDVLNPKTTVQYDILPPVVGAIQEIKERFNISFEGKRAVVLGAGRLVGAPAARYLHTVGADVTVLTKETRDPAKSLQTADILVLGAGEAGCVTPEMVKDGVVIFDAGTSEENGKLVGDADPACSEKATLITPVPGGIGPITIAVLLKNLVILAGLNR